MIFTARQIQDLHKSNGHIVLPYRARLTPMAQDWIKAQRLAIGYGDVSGGRAPVRAGSDGVSPSKISNEQAKFLYWCDGPCGPAKAALAAEGKDGDVVGQIAIQSEPSNLASVVKYLAKEISTGRAGGGILMVQYGASAMVFANRCPSLRAVLGTCIQAVEQGMQQVAANVLVIEYSYKSLHEVRSMLGRFVKAKRQLTDDVKKQLQELSTCA
jgi:ribose 5-phosphate isomerase RpiB